LFWNSDSANVPGRLYAWYLRNMYLENNLRVPGKLRILDRPVDLRAVRCPAFILATREDHIVPWRSAYASTQLLAGTIDFVLGASGHIAGVFNAPASGRRNYWIGPSTPVDADEWLSQAHQVAGSWWPCWSQWLRQHADRRIEASEALGSARHPVLEPAPGSYVRAADR
jgi:polyhydroxyalkanoate synthase subunit PhaC